MTAAAILATAFAFAQVDPYSHRQYLPDTPVTHVNLPRGMDTSTFLRLFSAAPQTVRKWPFPSLLFSGTGMDSVPAR